MPTLNTLLLCSLLLAAPQGGTPPHPAPAQPATEKQDPARTRELDLQYQMLCDTYARSEVEWNDLLRVYAGEAQKRNETLAKHPAKQYWERFQKLANDGQGRALVWMAGHAENMYPERETATQQKQVLFRKLIDEHASDPWALETVVSLSLQRYWLETKGVQSLLEDFVKQTKNREFAATALSKEMAILSGAASKTEEQKQADEVRDRIIHDYSDTEVGKKLAERQVMPFFLASSRYRSLLGSVLTPIRTKGSFLSRSTSDRSCGNMARQGPHQKPQKSSSTTFPL